MTKTDLLAAVQAHALKNYSKGWDVLVECCEDDEILSSIGDATTVDQAIRNVAEAQYLDAHVVRRNEALAAGGMETGEFDLGLD